MFLTLLFNIIVFYSEFNGNTLVYYLVEKNSKCVVIDGGLAFVRYFLRIFLVMTDAQTVTATNNLLIVTFTV
jgi:hypothetical protein